MVSCTQIARIWRQALEVEPQLQTWAAANLGGPLNVLGGLAPGQDLSERAPYVAVETLAGEGGTRPDEYEFSLMVSLGIKRESETLTTEEQRIFLEEVFLFLDTDFAGQVLRVLGKAHPDIERAHMKFLYEDAFAPVYSLDIIITVAVPRTLAARFKL